MRVTNNDDNPRWFGETLLYKGQSSDVPDMLIEEIKLNADNLPVFELGLIMTGGAPDQTTQAEDAVSEQPITDEESAPVTRKKNG